MKIKASGRSALILATGLLACIGASSLLAAESDVSKSVKHYRHYAHHRSSKAVAQSADSKQEAATATADNGGVTPATLPSSVANANAELAPADSLADSARAMTTRANDIVQAAADAQPPAANEVVAPDQLNDVDRALREQPPRQTVLAMASAEAPVTPAARATADSDNSAWDQTSLIGKIFIGFGALLTIASAARMFMA
jgi:hypothetical protein